MSHSQIDMAVLHQYGLGVKVCGFVIREAGNLPRPVKLYVVVQQGDVVAQGPGDSRDREVQAGVVRWEIDVLVQGEGHLTEGSAVASSVAFVENETAVGFETFTWLQKITILPIDSQRQSETVPHTPTPELIVSAQGQLTNGRSVASSLAIFEEKNPQGGETLSWHREFSIRPVVFAEVKIPPTAD